MAGMNRVTLLGNLGTQPELRHTEHGVAVCRFRLATSERRKDAQGVWADHTEWHNVVAFGRAGEVCGQYLGKGRQVLVEGGIRTRAWQDADGQPRHATEVVARDVQFLGNAAGARLAEGPATPAEGAVSDGTEIDDVPF